MPAIPVHSRTASRFIRVCMIELENSGRSDILPGLVNLVFFGVVVYGCSSARDPIAAPNSLPWYTLVLPRVYNLSG